MLTESVSIALITLNSSDGHMKLNPTDNNKRREESKERIWQIEIAEMHEREGAGGQWESRGYYMYTFRDWIIMMLALHSLIAYGMTTEKALCKLMGF